MFGIFWTGGFCDSCVIFVGLILVDLILDVQSGQRGFYRCSMDKSIFQYCDNVYREVCDYDRFFSDFRFCLLFDVMDNMTHVFDSVKITSFNIYNDFALTILRGNHYIKVEINRSLILIYSAVGCTVLSLYDCDVEAIVVAILKANQDLKAKYD